MAFSGIFDCVTQVSKKIADAKLAKDFEAVLKEFQKAQRLASREGNTLYHLCNIYIYVTKGISTVEDSFYYLNDAIIEEREQGIKEVQQQIDDIESNIGNTHAATIQAKSHLAQTCMLMMIFSIVLLIVIIVISA
ncbi:unnamed protein product [Spirodela intermedia]|uniref:Uncharacterized protein n=1 Tax=Spirodela intermedia TaxID=51605 RepID=A0ABN7EBX4_SPIIN|nr:unnamed protein product [Spirodela intermedia]